jgi:hypothetical protein
MAMEGSLQLMMERLFAKHSEEMKASQERASAEMKASQERASAEIKTAQAETDAKIEARLERMEATMQSIVFIVTTGWTL